MAFGFFGKVPQKGDYLAINLPPAVLGPLETWLSDAVSASRRDLGVRWQELYLVAPIWRFWLPPAVLGLACTGAIVSSVDSGGRYFPATIVFAAPRSRSIAPPPDWDSAPWYEALDARLLTILAEQDDHYLDHLLSGLVAPAVGSGVHGTQSRWWRGSPGSDDHELILADGMPSPATYAHMLGG